MNIQHVPGWKRMLKEKKKKGGVGGRGWGKGTKGIN